MGSLSPYYVPALTDAAFTFVSPTTTIQTMYTSTPTVPIEIEEFQADLLALLQAARITLERRIDGANWAIVSVIDTHTSGTVPSQIDNGLFLTKIQVDAVSHLRIRIQSYVDEGVNRNIPLHYSIRQIA